MTAKKLLGLLSALFFFSSCGESIFEAPPTSTGASSIVLPSPIAIQVSTVLNKVFLLNSDGEVNYNSGSLVQFSFDATDPLNPVLSADKVVTIRQFGAEMRHDDQFAYITNRKSSIESSGEGDAVLKVRIDDGSLSLVAETTVGPNPFGLDLVNGELFVLSDKRFDRLLASDLSQVARVNLAEADNGTLYVEGIAVDAASLLALVSNRRGELLAMDLTNNTVDFVVEDPFGTQGVAFGNGRFYVVDSNPPSLLVIDLSGLSDQTETVRIDDSEILVAQVDLSCSDNSNDEDPSQVALDVANNRAYVTLTGSDQVAVVDTSGDPALVNCISLAKSDIESGMKGGDQPFGLAVATFNAVPFVFVANYMSDSVSIINANTAAVVATYPE